MNENSYVKVSVADYEKISKCYNEIHKSSENIESTISEMLGISIR